MNAIDAVRTLFEQGEADSLGPWLADAVELRPPTYGKSWTGKPLVTALLAFAAEAMEGFRYTDAIGEGGLHILRFEARIGNEEISGVDLVRCDGTGQIVGFEIFARPPKAVLALRDAMAARVVADPAIAILMGAAAR